MVPELEFIKIQGKEIVITSTYTVYYITAEGIGGTQLTEHPLSPYKRLSKNTTTTTVK